MKVVLFCGGLGMRLREYTDDIPKPMVPIGNRPILWHLMKYYAHYGHKDFIVCLGYKGNVIKDYFLHYDEAVSNDFVWSNGGRNIEYVNRDIDDWRITFVETGAYSNVGERLRAVAPYVRDEEIFLANYGDGLSDVPLPETLETFRRSNAVAAMMLVQPTASFDMVKADEDGTVREIQQLSRSDVWINGGFFAMRPEIFRYIEPGEELVREPFQRLSQNRGLLGYRYTGFWACMDTFKDKQRLDRLNDTTAPWKVWKQGSADSLAKPRASVVAAGV
jgi:glucose-1-phosphate cytidylyltransferase